MKIDKETFLANKRSVYSLNRIVPIAHELRAFGTAPSGLGYGGTVDLVALVQGKLTVIDLKTGRRRSPTHGLQVAAYCHALSISNGAVLYLTDSGTPGLVDVDIEKGLRVFDQMLQLYVQLKDENMTDILLLSEDW